jgi:hypothetical protein
MLSSGTPSPRSARSVLWVPVVALLLLAGCSSTPRSYERAFSASQQMKGNAESIAAPMDVTWAAAMEVLSQQGFLVQQADTSSRIILATREIRDAEDEELTYTISATLTLFPSADALTRIMIAASQTTEMHTSEHTWWHLLWIIPLFPTGTEYTTVVVDRDTVQSPQFYVDFLDAVKASCATRTGSQAVTRS